MGPPMNRQASSPRSMQCVRAPIRGPPQLLAPQAGLLAQQGFSYHSNRERALVGEAAMAKIGRNQPCPCGSGKKYKRCCWHRDRAAHVHTAPAVSAHRYRFAQSELDRLSNSVLDLVDQGRLKEADAVCDQLRTRYPEVHDWLMRKAMVCEARGETELAIEYCERTIAWMDAHPEDFDPESREPFVEDIERLRASLHGTC